MSIDAAIRDSPGSRSRWRLPPRPGGRSARAVLPRVRNLRSICLWEFASNSYIVKTICGVLICRTNSRCGALCRSRDCVCSRFCEQLLAAHIIGWGAYLMIRIIHTIGGCGGTLLSRCIGVLPNVALLSEINPCAV